jgi:hypothetical protein
MGFKFILAYFVQFNHNLAFLLAYFVLVLRLKKILFFFIALLDKGLYERNNVKLELFVFFKS